MPLQVRKGKAMQTVLHRYYSDGQDYLIFDTRQNGVALSSRSARTICSQNFGIGSRAIVSGPAWGSDGMQATVYRPDGTETQLDQSTAPVFFKYLEDAGYISDTRRGSSPAGPLPSQTGTIFFYESI